MLQMSLIFSARIGIFIMSTADKLITNCRNDPFIFQLAVFDISPLTTALSDRFNCVYTNFVR